MRSLRVRNDENIPPEGHVLKTLHQRNKSSPALTTASTGYGLKVAAKRTAFGDVSNVAAGRPSKDDSLLQSKASLYPSTKPLPPLHEHKSARLLQPAQRPTSLSALKSFLPGGNNDKAATLLKLAPVENPAALPQPTNARRLTKRNTTIFKDTSAVEENEVSQSTTTIDQKVPQVDLTKLEHDLLPLRPALEIQDIIEPIKVDNDVQCKTSVPSMDQVHLDPPHLSSDMVNYGSQLPTTNPEPTKVQNMLPVSSREPRHPLVTLPRVGEVHVVTAEQTEVDVSNFAHPSNNLASVNSQMPYDQQLAEPEEYWDEEDEDNYEEEGFVTARSFRSKGDNTTGGVSAVLFPQVNNRVRKELAAAKQLVDATRSPEEVEDESYDTSMVAEYGDEIFAYMQELEVKLLPNAHYMDNQHEIQWSMRSVLMDWLVKVHHRFNLLPETLFLCVNYIDRFLSNKVVSLAKLQLVGATAIFIAAKYEEINCPSVQEIVYMVDGGYSVDEILKAERFMLTMLQFELGWPGPMSFLRRISKADDYDLETRTLAKYFLEVTLMDERFIGSPPSFTAAASHCLSRFMLRKGVWTAHHVYYSGYTLSQLKPLLNLLLECCEDPRKHHTAVFEKYQDKRYKRAAAFVETEMQRGFQLPDAGAVGHFQQAHVIQYYDSVSYFRP
ncbi:hypothetical protein B0A52_01424 [Exophiala mesophila]|uniref:Uncharacterized protein n=1 Tax=Exophiala mesophila TaxID=212818 RepID=A0A438NHE8_EXOME|nr:hypothetical protein B0A52_01424 [Exophiala mesophila]